MSNTFRCAECGRVFDNSDICPECGCPSGYAAASGLSSADLNNGYDEFDEDDFDVLDELDDDEMSEEDYVELCDDIEVDDEEFDEEFEDDRDGVDTL